MNKTKILVAVLTASALTAGAGALAGCGHSHTYSEDWEKDETGHWHVATCDDLKEGDEGYTNGFADHVWGDDDVCDVCDYRQVHTITFNANGGTLTGATTANTVNGKLASLPSDPTPATDKEFLGWFDAATGGNAVTTSTDFKADATVYAQYGDIYTITLDAGEDGELSGAATLKTVKGKLTALPAAPTVESEDKEFIGWYTTADDEEEEGVEVTLGTLYTANTTIYARYGEIYTVTLTVDSESGSYTGETTLKTVRGQIALLPEPTCTKENWHFTGWAVNGGDGTLIDETEYVFEANTQLDACFARNDGLWSEDGSEMIATLVVNDGNGDATLVEHWFGAGKKVFIEAGTTLTIYIDGVKKTNFWLKGALTNGGANGANASSVTISEDANFEVYIKNYLDGGTTYEFNGSPASFAIVSEIPEGSSAINVTWGESNSITFYLIDTTGAGVGADEDDNIEGYYLYAYNGSSYLFENWQAGVLNGTGALKTEMAGSTNVTTTDITFIFRWGAINTTTGNEGDQTANLAGMLTGHSYIIDLGTSNIQEYVAPEADAE